MKDLTKEDILIENLLTPERLKKIVIDTGDWSFSKEEADHIRQTILENQDIRKKYSDIVSLFVSWNEKIISDEEFAQKAVSRLENDYNKFRGIESDG